ncbi:MAG: hypothetical protein VYB80_02630 [Actinomycetota bacterium]|nr:hypothetical protein [Actinomycetota bacterium]
MMQDNSQFVSLVLAKLRSLAATFGQSDPYEEESFHNGALLFNSSRIIAYSASDEISILSIALTHHAMNQKIEVHLIVDQENPVLYEQKLGFDLDIRIWIVEGKELIEHPEIPAYHPKTAPKKARSLSTTLEKLDCLVIEEHGALRAEVHGVEVARIVQTDKGAYEINVGVGEYDQNAHSTLTRDADTGKNLRQVISTVKQFRHKKASPHPLNRILRSRWLMSEAISNPALLGMEKLSYVESLSSTYDSLRNQPCSALGRRGETVTLVLSTTGIDLSLVPHAGGQINRHNPDALIFLMPEQDKHPAIFRQAQHLLLEPTFTMIDEPWPESL